MTSYGDKKEIDEIITKYEFEPSLDKEIYVEGSSDKALVEWFLKRAGVKNITVLEISTVNIEPQKVFDLSLNDNNRDRIITLCHLVESGVLGIIDSDFDYLDKKTYPYSHLLKTDYASMEGYCFNEEVLEKVFLGYTSKQPQNYKLFLDMLADVLIELFLIRFAKEKLYKKQKYLDFDDKKYLSIKNNSISLDRDKYLENYFKHKVEMIDAINYLIENQKKSLPSDSRKIMQGHDFETLLQFYLGIKRNVKEKIFEKSLYSALEYKTLKDENMFINLLKQVEL